MGELKALITGCHGYIASHMVQAFAEGAQLQGYNVKVTGFDKVPQHQTPSATKDYNFIRGNILNPQDLTKLFTQDYDIVIHFAGLIDAGESHRKPLLYTDVNVNGAKMLFSEMVATEAKNILFSSTAAVYQSSSDPLTEDSIKEPDTPYGSSKLAVERMLFHCINAYGFNPVVLRYFNLAGAHPRGIIGENHLGTNQHRGKETHLITRVILEGIINQQGLDKVPTKIFGDDYDTPDKTCIRDFIHVQDLISAHLLAANALLKGNLQHKVFNLGSKTGYSVRQVIDSVKRVTGLPIEEEVAPRRGTEAAILVADSSRAETELGWQRQFGLDDMIKHAHEYYKNRPDLVEAYRQQKAKELKAMKK